MPAEFVGRAADVTALAALRRTAERSSAPVVGLVTGPPGRGKTRLLDEICAGLADADVVRIRGHEAESGIPLAAAAGLLRSLASSPGGTLVERLVVEDAGPPGDSLQLFEAAARAVCSRPSLHMVVDDLQWVDRTSRALLHYAVRAAEFSGSPLVLLAAGRPGAGTDLLFESLAGVLADPERLLRLELAPLSAGESAALARSLAPEIRDATLDRVVEQSEGSPFWIEVLALEGGSGGAAGALDRRLRSATGDAGVLASVLAVLGRSLEREGAADVLRWPLSRIDAAADDLLALGLASDDGTSLAVGHPIIRDRVLERLDAGAAGRLHRMLGRWLADRATDQPTLLEAVEHSRRGGVALVGAALRLARSPQRRLLGRPGLDLLRTIADEVDPRTADGAALQDAVTRLANELGEHEIALAGWSAILTRATDPDVAADAALRAAECAMHLDRAGEAERFLAQAARASPADLRTAAEVHARTAGVLLWLRHRGDDGCRAGAEAVRAARDLARRAGGAERLPRPDRAAYVRGLLAGAEAAIHADRPGEVLDLTEELVALGGVDDPRSRVRALTEGALALRWLGRNADAEARLRLVWAEVRRDALPQATLEVGALLAKVLQSRGRLAEADDVLGECRRLGRRLAEFCPSRAFTPLIGYLVSASRGNWRPAVEGLAAEVAVETDPHYRAHVRLERALLLARYDSRRAAPDVQADVAAALADAAAAGCRRCDHEVHARGAEALARVGDPPRARDLLAARVPDPHGGNRALLFWAAQARAAVLTAEGARDAAVDAWEATVAEADRCGFVLEGLWARIDLGGALALGDRGAAADVLREAGEEAERTGAVTELQAVEQGLRALGVRTWRRSSASPTGLTEREQEIASRVASGASNADIAAAMFLSRKTVERHVSNVLAKAGLRNRAELAAAWSARDTAAR